MLLCLKKPQSLFMTSRAVARYGWKTCLTGKSSLHLVSMTCKYNILCLPCLVLSSLFLSYSDTVQYQTIYSGGNGLVFVLGLVPNSHIVIVEYKIEDGEIMNKVLLSVWNYLI